MTWKEKAKATGNVCAYLVLILYPCLVAILMALYYLFVKYVKQEVYAFAIIWLVFVSVMIGGMVRRAGRAAQRKAERSCVCIFVLWPLSAHVAARALTLCVVPSRALCCALQAYSANERAKQEKIVAAQLAAEDAAVIEHALDVKLAAASGSGAQTEEKKSE